MKKASEIINIVKSKKNIAENIISQDTLLSWLNDIEKYIFETIYKKPDDFVTLTIDSTLSVDTPYTEVYETYLLSKIDFTNEEYETYNNELSMYNAVLTQFAAWYNREKSETTGIKISNYW